MNPLKRRKRGTASQELTLAVARPLAILTAYVTVMALRSVLTPSSFTFGGDLKAMFPFTVAAWLLLAAPLAGLALGLIVIRITNNIGGHA